MTLELSWTLLATYIYRKSDILRISEVGYDIGWIYNYFESQIAIRTYIYRKSDVISDDSDIIT